MKRNYLYYFLGIVILLSACKKDEMTYTTEVETIEVSSLINNTATSGGIITSDGKPTVKERGLEWCISTEFEKDVQKIVAKETGLGEFSCVMTDLQQRTTYYVRAYAKNDFGIVYGNVQSFITPAIPIVLTADIEYETGTSFITGGIITDDGDSTILARGICWGTDSLLTIDGLHTSDSVGIGKFTSVVDSLTLGTKYYVRAYAKNAAGIGYGEIKSVTTHNYPKVTTDIITEIKYTSAIGGGVITDNGGTNILSCGICWAKMPIEPTIEDIHTRDTLNEDKFSSILTELEEGETYNVRAYAINSIGLTYGDIVSFRSDFYAPTVITFAAANITSNSATCGGEVTSNGGGVVTERGVCYSTSEMPTTIDKKILSGSGIGRFDCKLADLLPGTTYYVRAYAVNGKGTSYGEQKTFTTEAVLAIIKTLDVTNITATSATCGGNVTSDGGASVTERGICYSTSKNPTISDMKVTSGSGIGTFSCELTNLSKGTIYYVRAYAINSKGIVYGEQKMFTSGATKATITTNDVTNITTTSVTCGGNVTADGGATVTERGVCYSTSENPTISDTKVSSGSGTGSFSCNITNLADGTTYYVRAYATNSMGTSYGEQKTFTTTAIVKPTVITSDVTNITTTSATCGGNVTADGGATVTERGVCYSTGQNPTIYNSKVTSGTGTGSFTCNLSGLSDGTTYYVRAYAINGKGVSYGEQKTITTIAIVKPTVTTSTVTNITTTSATCGGNVTSDGGTTVTERGVCYSTSQNPTISNSKVSSGSGTGSFSCNLTNLVAETSYYVRAYATNSKGTSYGEQKTFTTTAAPPSNHLVFMSNQNGSTIGLVSLATHQTIEYSTDYVTWNSMTTTTTVTLNNGEKIYVRGILSDHNNSIDYTQFVMTGSIAAKGNLNYLWNYQNLNAQLKAYCGYALFKNCSALVSSPILPATTLAEYCYRSMFAACSGLIVAPELPATILQTNCYAYMFTSCTKLKYIKCLATNISAIDCTTGWVNKVASSGTFVKNSSMNSWTQGTSGIPNGWTVTQ